MTYTYEQITKKIESLREEWKQAVGVDRKLIEARAKLLKWSIEKYDIAS